MLPERARGPVQFPQGVRSLWSQPEPGAGARRLQERLGALPYSLSFELCRYVHPCSIHPEEGRRAEIEQGYVNQFHSG